MDQSDVRLVFLVWATGHWKKRVGILSFSATLGKQAIFFKSKPLCLDSMPTRLVPPMTQRKTAVMLAWGPK